MGTVVSLPPSILSKLMPTPFLRAAMTTPHCAMPKIYIISVPAYGSVGNATPHMCDSEEQVVQA